MKTLHKQSCPTCGQSVNERIIGLSAIMVDALRQVFRWCVQTGKYEDVSRHDFAHVWSGSESVTGTFAYWRDFTKETGMVTGENGRYSFDLEKIAQFLGGKLAVPTVIIRNPLTKQDVFDEYRFVEDVADVTAFLDEDRQYIVRYLNPLPNPEQAPML